MKKEALLKTTIYARCIDLQDFAKFLQANCGLSMEKIEQRGRALAVEYALRKGVVATITDNRIIFHPVHVTPGISVI